MEHYVLGFIFDQSKKRVLLVKKNRPDWQAGRWNGIGGKIDPLDASPLAAMERENMEEIGVPYDWEHCVTFICPGGTVFVFTNSDFLGDDISFNQIEDEKLRVWRVDVIDQLNVMNNLKRLIPVCLSTLQFPLVVHDMKKEVTNEK